MDRNSVPNESGLVERRFKEMRGMKKRRGSPTNEMRPIVASSEIAIDDFLTVDEMFVSSNEQTWLYCDKDIDPNEEIDIYTWLHEPYVKENSDKLYSLLEECPEGGGVFNMDDQYGQPIRTKDDQHAGTKCFTKELPSPSLDKSSLLNQAKSNKENYIIPHDPWQAGKKLSVHSDDMVAESDEILENISSPSICLLDNITMRPSPVSSSLTESESKRILEKTFRSPGQSRSNFCPVSVSTPTRTNYQKENATFNRSYDGSDYGNDSYKSEIEEEKANVTDPGLYVPKLDNTATVPSNSLLSKSDPSILDSVQDIPRRKSLNTNCDLYKYSVDKACDEANNTSKNFGTYRKIKTPNSTFTLEHKDDNACSTLDRTYKTSNHIRSLGDVRSLAKQQEETLMSSRAIRPGLKKGLSDDCSIHTSTDSSTTLKTAKSSLIYGSTSSISNNNNNTNLGGGFLRRATRYGLSSPGTRCPRSAPTTAAQGIRPGSHAPAGLRGSGIRPPSIIVSRIPRSLSRIPTPNTGSNMNRGNWRDGCY